MPKAWLTNTLHRIFPTSGPQASKALKIAAARGERISLQVGFHNDGGDALQVKASASAPDGLALRLRRVGNIPMPHRNTDTPKDESEGWDLLPGFAPDPLFEEAEAWIGPQENTAFWITIQIARDAKPGDKTVAVELHFGKDEKITLQATIAVSSVVLEKRKDFRVGHWFGCDSLIDYYKLEPFGKDFWPVCDDYMANYAAHGNDTILTPVFTPPTDGIKRPTQLLLVKKSPGGKYHFNWKLVSQFVKMARKNEIDYFQFPHFFTQWGCEHAIRIYEKKGGKDVLLWPPKTGATSKTYRNFLAQYLPALERFMAVEKIGKRSFFSVSDEPHGEQHLVNYRAARQMLRELAPWMKVGDALSDIRYGREKITDFPIPISTKVEEFLAEGIPCSTYFCCGPRGRYINRCMDTPLWKIRMNGWVCYKLGVLGFLHWGYNYWYKHCTQEIIDPFKVTDGGRWPLLPYGDTFVVYPGADKKPIDALRWEVFYEGLQDYALMQTLQIERDARILAPVRNFKDFPREENWIEMARRKMLATR